MERVRTPPREIGSGGLGEALFRHWNVVVDRLDFLPVGGGAFHWVGTTADGQRWFVTCDDLDAKPWLGADRASAFRGLVSAYQVAADLRNAGGLGFVVAPVPALAGDVAVRLAARFAVALFPHVSGRPGSWGAPIGDAGRGELIALLARLHGCTGVARTATHHPRAVPGRTELDKAMDDLERPWEGGPFSEPMRRALSQHAGGVSEWLAEFDGLASRPGASDRRDVITHGEPHPANLIGGLDGLALVDWDTVALDRPERDLWMLDDGSGSAWSAYTELTGRRVDPGAVRFYRLGWALTDLAAFTTRLRAPHVEDADTARAFDGARRVLAGDEPAPYGAPSGPVRRSEP